MPPTRRATPAQLPPTAAALFALLVENGDRLDYHDPRVTTSGLTALRRRWLAVVDADLRPALIVLTSRGRERAELARAEKGRTP